MKRVIQIVCGSVLLLYALVICCSIAVNATAHAYIVQGTPPPDGTHKVAIVLGAATYSDGTLSPIFSDRLDTAALLYKEGIVSKILVSGDNGSTTYNEVNPARMYLLSKQVSDADIFLDHAGFDTYSTMYRAHYIFKVSSAIIVTQSFHLPRALFIAHELGITAYGIHASDDNAALKDSVREQFADVKAVFEVLVDAKPKYLGKAIPITGDGRNDS